MVAFIIHIALIILSSMPGLVVDSCMEFGGNITDGAWNFIGVNSTWIPERYDENKVNTQNPSWTVPDGNWKYPHGEMERDYLTQYTCSILQFCNPEINDDGIAARRSSEQQDIYRMANKTAFEICSFEGAEFVGTTNATTCVEIAKDDLSALGIKEYYADKQNCAAGQKVAVTLADWKSTNYQCAAIANHVPASSRLRGCDCDFQKKSFQAGYNGLCAYSYQEACMDIMMPGDCCESSTCMSKIEIFSTPEGEAFEIARREKCDDDIPGNCYNQDGRATDLSMDGSTDCCSQTCSSCGSELAQGAVFEMCTSNSPDEMTATCGRLSRYAPDEFICDFSMCPSDSRWGSNGDAIFKYMNLPKPDSDSTLSGAPERSSSARILTAAVISSTFNLLWLSTIFTLIVSL